MPRFGKVLKSVTMMVMSYFLALEVPNSLRGSIYICTLGGTPSPRVPGFRGRSATKIGLWAYNPMCGLSIEHFGCETTKKLIDLTLGGCRGPLEEKGDTLNTK